MTLCGYCNVELSEDSVCPKCGRLIATEELFQKQQIERAIRRTRDEMTEKFVGYIIIAILIILAILWAVQNRNSKPNPYEQPVDVIDNGGRLDVSPGN